MTDKHTSAPWYAIKNSADFWDICIEDEEYSPLVGGGCMVWNEYDAQLISAAPDMLREMESLAQALEDVYQLPQSFFDAIKKARGKT